MWSLWCLASIAQVKIINFLICNDHEWWLWQSTAVAPAIHVIILIVINFVCTTTWNDINFEIPTEGYFKIKVEYHCLQNSLLVEENMLLMKCLNRPFWTSLSLFFKVSVSANCLCFQCEWKLIFTTETLHWVLLWIRGWSEFKSDPSNCKN